MRRCVWLLAALAVAGCGSDDEGRESAGTLEQAPPARTQTQPADGAPRQKSPLVHVQRKGALILRRTKLRRTINGPVVTTVKRKTTWNSRAVLAVVATRGKWLGVLHPELGRGRKMGWIPAESARVLDRTYEIVIDRSRLRGTLYRDERFVQHFRVGVGRKGNPTPLGRYAITDRLIPGPGSPYGCCILALTASQPSLPQGWTGGDRIALHGGPARRVGVRTTSGCVTVGAKPLTRMFRRVTAGTRVTVVA